MKLFLAFILGFVIFHFYRKRKIESVILLLIVALVKYEVTIGSKVILVNQIISLILICYTILIASKVTVFRFRDKKIFKAVVLFIVSLSFSALLMRADASLFGRLQLCFDYAFLFFVTLFCLNTFKDIQKLIKGMHLGIVLVAIIGIVGVSIGNPFFGFEESSFILYSDDYFQNINYYNTYGGGSLSFNRVSFSASDPNSLGILMVFGVVLVFHLLKTEYSKLYRQFCYISLGVFLISLILSSSRTALFILIIIFAFKLQQDSRKIFKNLFLFLVLFISVYFIAIEFGYVENLLYRLSDQDQIQDGNGRVGRWFYHFNNLNLQYLMFGNSYTGFQGSSTMSHTNFLALIYRGGLLAFFSFLYLIFRLFKAKNNYVVPFRTFSIIILIASVTQEIINSYGPNFILWPILAILAYSSKYVYINESYNSSSFNMPQQKR